MPCEHARRRRRGVVDVVYGLAKIVGGQFYHPGRIPADVAATPLGEAAAFELAWTFMGYSFLYRLFIGLAEVAGAWLLLAERTKLLGVAVLLPIMVNILVFDVVFLDKFGALASATIYTLLLLLLLILNREQVGRALHALTTVPAAAAGAAAGSWKRRTTTIGLALLAMAVLFAFDQLLVNLLGHGRG